MTAQAEVQPLIREALPRPLLTLMASGRNDSYQAISRHPSYFKSERQLSLAPTGRIRPIAVFQL